VITDEVKGEWRKLHNEELNDYEVRHPRCVGRKLQNGKSTVKTQLSLLAMRGQIT